MHLAEEPLTKATLNFFTSDIEYLKQSPNWTINVRNIVHNHVQELRRRDRARLAENQKAGIHE